MNEAEFDRDIQFLMYWLVIEVIYALKHNLTDVSGPNFTTRCSYDNVKKEYEDFAKYKFESCLADITTPSVNDDGSINRLSFVQKMRAKRILSEARDTIYPIIFDYFRKNSQWDFSSGRQEYVNKEEFHLYLVETLYSLLNGALAISKDRSRDGIEFRSTQKGWFNRKAKYLAQSLESNLQNVTASSSSDLLTKINILKNEFNVEAKGLLID